jgi:hypothetical protein
MVADEGGGRWAVLALEELGEGCGRADREEAGVPGDVVVAVGDVEPDRGPREGRRRDAQPCGGCEQGECREGGSSASR